MRHCRERGVNKRIALIFDRGIVRKYDKAVQRFKKQYDAQKNCNNAQLAILLFALFLLFWLLFFDGFFFRQELSRIFVCAAAVRGF